MFEFDDLLLNKVVVSFLEWLLWVGFRFDVFLLVNEVFVVMVNDYEVKKKFLFVNDNKIVIKIFKVLMRKFGYECEVVENGKEGVVVYVCCFF